MPITKRILKFAVTALTPVALLAATSCSSQPPANIVEPTDPSAYSNESGVGGEVIVDALSMTATIVSIDPVRREAVLKRTDGKTITCKAKRDSLEFAALKAGDIVSLAVGEERAVFLGKNSVPANAGSASARVRVRVPDNVQAIAESIASLAFSARIMAIDTYNDIVTLRLPDGLTKQVKVTEAMNLGDFNPGDDVSVRITEATVIVVQKP